MAYPGQADRGRGREQGGWDAVDERCRKVSRQLAEVENLDTGQRGEDVPNIVETAFGARSHASIDLEWTVLPVRPSIAIE